MPRHQWRSVQVLYKPSSPEVDIKGFHESTHDVNDVHQTTHALNVNVAKVVVGQRHRRELSGASADKVWRRSDVVESTPDATADAVVTLPTENTSRVFSTAGVLLPRRRRLCRHLAVVSLQPKRRTLLGQAEATTTACLENGYVVRTSARPEFQQRLISGSGASSLVKGLRLSGVRFSLWFVPMNCWSLSSSVLYNTTKL